MLLSQIITNQQNRYATIQNQIDDLQAQQRQIQGYLQQLGSVESKMEAAAALLQEAIAEVSQICPDELESYQATIDSLFNVAIAALPEVTEPEATEETTEVTATATETIDVTEVTTATDETIEETEVTATIDTATTKETDTETIDVTEVTTATTDPDTTATTNAPLDSLKVSELRELCRRHNVNDKGSKTILINRLATLPKLLST